MATDELLLPKWFPIFKSCGKCDSNGFIISFSGKAKKCNCKIDFEKKAFILKSLLQANVINADSSIDYVESLYGLSFDDYKGPDNNGNLGKIKKFCYQFSDKYRSLNLFFSGKPGTQKSTLAKIMIKTLIELNNSTLKCYYILANDLIEMIISSSREEKDKDTLDDIAKVDFLVIDEFDEDKIITYASGWQRKNLFPWIKKRLELIKKSTLFISNKNIDSIGDYFEEAIQDLIIREIPDKTMIFEDKYYVYNGEIDLSSIWNND